jgi:hypothetical protein
MQLNADFSQRVAVHGDELAWVASPILGVERKMLDRVGGEVARATSLVRYAPRSRFSRHIHDGGEEFFVLEGLFSDEHGDFPAGSYIRNPPTSQHTPGSEPGCLIFVKLWQFAPDDRRQLRLDTTGLPFGAAPHRPGVTCLPLFKDQHEDVRLERWAPDCDVTLAAPGGLEFMVIAGGFQEGGERFRPQSWLRLPAGGRLKATADASGCTLWAKLGHLARVQRTPPGTDA